LRSAKSGTPMKRSAGRVLVRHLYDRLYVKFSDPKLESSYQEHKLETCWSNLANIHLLIFFCGFPMTYPHVVECGGSLRDCDVRTWGMHFYIMITHGISGVILKRLSADRHRLRHYTGLGPDCVLLVCLLTTSIGFFFKGLFRELSHNRGVLHTSYDTTLAWAHEEAAMKTFCVAICNLAGCLSSVNILRFNAVCFLMVLPSGFSYTVEVQGMPTTVNSVDGGDAVRMAICLISIPLCAYQSWKKDLLRRSSFAQLQKVSVRHGWAKKAATQMLPERLLVQVDTICETLEPLVESFPSVTVMFSTFCQESMQRIEDATELRLLMGRIFSACDRAVQARQLAKVEHVCSDYLVCSREIEEGPEAPHASGSAWHRKHDIVSLVQLAQEILHITRAHCTSSGQRLEMKIGIHSGPLTGGIAGQTLRFYRLFGDTVNTAARLAQSAPNGRIQLSADVKRLLPRLAGEESQVALELPRQKYLKGRGMVTSYLVEEETTSQGGGQGALEADRRKIRSSVAHVSEDACFEERMPLPLQTYRLSTACKDNQEVDRYQEWALAENRKDLKGILFIGPTIHLGYCIIAMGVTGTTTKHGQCLALLITLAAAVSGSYVVARKLLLYGSLTRHQEMANTVSLVGLNWALQMGSIACLVHIGYSFEVTALGMMLMCLVYLVISPCITSLHLLVDLVACALAFCAPNAPGSLVQTVQLAIVLLGMGGIHQLSARQAEKNRRFRWALSQQHERESQKLLNLLRNLVPSIPAMAQLMHRNSAALNMCELSQELSGSVLVDNHMAVVLHIDLVGFTEICRALDSHQVLLIMHDVWCLMDSALERLRAQINQRSATTTFHSTGGLSLDSCQLFKMETVGDAYIAAAMMGNPSAHMCAESAGYVVCLARKIAKDLQRYSKKGLHGLAPGRVKVRMGMCVGNLSVGIMGALQPRYHVHGEGVSTAAKLESQSKPYHLCVNADTLRYMDPEYSSDQCFLIDLLFGGVHQYPISKLVDATTDVHSPVFLKTMRSMSWKAARADSINTRRAASIANAPQPAQMIIPRREAMARRRGSV